MPLSQSAKKALRKDRRRTRVNRRLKERLKKVLKAARKTPTLKTIAAAASILDRAAKKNFIHKNKANRLKSRLSRLLQTKSKEA